MGLNEDESLDAQIQKLYQAVMAAVNPDGTMDIYVYEIYSDFAIVQNYTDAGIQYFQVPYTIQADGTAALGAWTQIERVWQPTGKALYQSKSAKSGARNNSTDLERLQAIHDLAVENGAACGSGKNHPAKSINTDEIIFVGGPVKATKLENGDVKLGGYLVVFGDENKTDLEGDYFTKSTDFGVREDAYGWFHHRMPLENKGVIIQYTEPLPMVKLRKDDVGVFAEVVIGARNDYDAMIAQLGIDNKLSWSSGTAPHLVDRKLSPSRKAYEITRWPLGDDASLTPTPAEPRTTVTPLKSLAIPSVQPPDAAPAAETTTATKSNHTSGDKGMETEEIKTIVKPMVEDAVKAAIADLPKNIEDAVKAIFDKQPPTNGAGLYAPNYNKSTKLGSGDEEVKRAFIHGLCTQDWAPYKAVMLGQVDAQGGYAVPDQFIPGIVAKRGEGSIIRKMGVTPVPCTNDKLLVPVEDTAATKFVVTAENAAYDENEPTLNIGLGAVYKLTKMIKLGEELSEDAPGLDTYLTSVWGRAMALAENYYLVSGGTGTSMPQAMLNGATSSGITTASATAITPAELLQLEYAIGEAYADNLALVMRRATLGLFRALTGNPFQFSPNPSGEGNALNPGSLAGVQVYCTDAMPAATATNKAVMVCNPDFYRFGVREGLTIFVDPYTYRGANGLIGYLARFRMGGFVAQSEAFQYLTMHA